jgi:hypothetical protein
MGSPYAPPVASTRASVPMPHAHSPQPAGGLGGPYASPPPTPFSFPEMFRPYSDETPTIGKTFSSSLPSIPPCTNPVLSLLSFPLLNSTYVGVLDESISGAPPTQGKMLPA